jgi:N-acetyl-alpha-D-glucosaminyl L-malate synthase BshA
MKIGVLCHGAYGGSGVVAVELGRHMARKGHQVHFICTEKPFRLNRFEPNVYLHQVEAYDYPLFTVPPYFLMEVNKIVEVSQAFKLDLLHAHYAIPHAASAFLAGLVGENRLPVVTTLHGTDVALVGRHRDFYATTRFSLLAGSRLTAVSGWLAAETERVFQLGRPIEVIYNFINPEEYRRNSDPALRKALAGEDEKIIIHISNFRPLKRVEDVVHIFYLITRALPARLVLVGDGPAMPAVKALVNECGLENMVHYMGVQDYVQPLLSIADLLLLPSEKESFGLAALEGMACEVPVVGSRSGGLPEVVSHGECGLLAAPGDVDEMSRLALDILSNPVWHNKLSRGARDVAETRFNAARWVNRYEQLYYSCLKKS